MHIPYESFPASFEACWLSGCALQSKCLHRLCQDVKPKNITMGRAIMQEALLPEDLVDGHCPHYSEAVEMKAYADFSHLFDEVKAKDLKTVHREVYDLLGSHRDFNRSDNAERPYILTEDLAQQVNAIFHSYGYPTPRYGQEFYTVVFDWTVNGTV